ncbi:MAG: tetratricopeptide repeat protein [Spirochaetes bacterium]|nr:tetratricopeptide repeat protein [Spirochaetota bacterium]
MLKEIITNIKLWAIYFQKMIENRYLSLSQNQKDIALYAAIGIGALLFIILPVLLIILSASRKKAKAVSVPLTSEEIKVLPIKEKEDDGLITEENVKSVEELLETEEQIREEEKNLSELQEETGINVEEDQKVELSDGTPLEEIAETGDETEIEEIFTDEDTRDIVEERLTKQDKVITPEGEDEILLPDGDELADEYLEKIETEPLGQQDIQHEESFEGTTKDEFVLQVKNDMEAEFINLVKRYYPDKMNYRTYTAIEDEVITKCKSILEKLTTLEKTTGRFKFSKDYYTAKSLYLFSAGQDELLNQNLIQATGYFPKEDIFLLQWASYHIYINQIQKAEKELLKAKELNPSNIEMYLLLGVVYFKQNKFYDSLNKFKKVILLDTKNSEAYAYKGYILANKGYISDGEKDLKKSISLNYQNHLPYYFMGNIYKEVKEYGKAIAMYKKSIKFGGMIIDLFENLGLCFIEVKKYDSVIKRFLPLYDKNELSVKGIGILSIALQEKEQYEKAIEILNRALEKSDEAEYHYRLGDLYEKTGEYEKSIEHYTKTKIEGKEADINLKIADVYFLKLNLTDQAEKYYLLALEKDAANYQIIRNLASLYYVNNSFEKCITYFDKVIKHKEFKIAPEVFYKAGIALSKLKRFDEAIKHLTKAESSGYVDESLYKTLGFAYIKENKVNKAVEAYKKSIAINPYNPVLRNNIGVIYAQMGDYTLAIKEFKSALKSDKDNKEALHNLYKAYKILSEQESEQYLSQLEEIL